MAVNGAENSLPGKPPLYPSWVQLWENDRGKEIYCPSREPLEYSIFSIFPQRRPGTINRRLCKKIENSFLKVLAGGAVNILSPVVLPELDPTRIFFRAGTINRHARCVERNNRILLFFRFFTCSALGGKRRFFGGAASLRSAARKM